MTRRIRTAAALVALTALALTACGSSGGSKTGTGASGGSQPAASTTSPGPASSSSSAKDRGSLPSDACSLLTPDQVATVLPGAGAGKADTQVAEGLVECTWDSTTGQLALRVTDFGKLGMPGDPPLILAGGSDEQHVDGVGDGLVIAKVGPGANLLANVGQTQIGIDLILLGAWPSVKDPMVALARTVADQL